MKSHYVAGLAGCFCALAGVYLVEGLPLLATVFILAGAGLWVGVRAHVKGWLD